MTNATGRFSISLSLSILSQITSPVCVCRFSSFVFFFLHLIRLEKNKKLGDSIRCIYQRQPGQQAPSQQHTQSHTHTFHSDMSDAYRLRILWPRRFIFFFF